MSEPNGVLRFGTFELDPRSRSLWKHGHRLKLQNQPFEILLTLVRRPGELVRREEFKQQIWPGIQYGDFETALNRSINKVREVLGDSANNSRFIETIPRQGYRFIAPVIGSSSPEVRKNGDTSLAAYSAISQNERERAAPNVTSSDRPVVANNHDELSAQLRPLMFPRSEASPKTAAWISRSPHVLLAIMLGCACTAFLVLLLHRSRAGVSAETGAVPSNQEAYELYLRSLSFAHDGSPNEEAISLLQRAVGLDPVYAPAWYRLGMRYEYRYVYDRGGPGARRNAEAALKKAVVLAPSLAPAAGALIHMRAEDGDVSGAYSHAHGLLAAYPQKPEAHFAMSLVLRYAGLLDESAAQCEEALAIEPHNATLRTCAQTFLRKNDYKKAEEYIRLDAGSDWAEGMELLILARQGEYERALKETRLISGMAAPLLRACISHANADEIERLAIQEEKFPVEDPEARYHVGSIEAFCGLKESSIRLLLQAAERGYCIVPDIKSDPLLVNVRTEPGLKRVADAAQHCQQAFLKEQVAIDSQPQK
jgi:DNA-binding winged helix-turn-helix (wHTH) protein/Flp pilus assembly protein TadD